MADEPPSRLDRLWELGLAPGDVVGFDRAAALARTR